ncbi:hypothetical protein QC764_0000080 [Podospora pseudoanserina]|uniref:Uncharacterized protein n=1 Tax=Podospora pseudoanserina TaxID=2609844 RepID=A0ABR0IJI6_9PEZI|nr:hypothetical protein QC764_0000080 [Podospora pseudoanserina]
MGSSWILCGLKGSVSTLNACLVANGQDLIYGTPCFHAHHPDKDTISRLLLSKISAINHTADKNRFRVLIPGLRGYPRSPVAYVTHAWPPSRHISKLTWRRTCRMRFRVALKSCEGIF